jgi:hypothetical protein
VLNLIKKIGTVVSGLLFAVAITACGTADVNDVGDRQMYDVNNRGGAGVYDTNRGFNDMDNRGIYNNRGVNNNRGVLNNDRGVLNNDRGIFNPYDTRPDLDDAILGNDFDEDNRPLNRTTTR